MSSLIKNKTTSDIELEDIGITIPKDEVYYLEEELKDSEKLLSLMQSGDVVLVDDTNVEMSVADTVKFVNFLSEKDYNRFFTKQDILGLIQSAKNYTDSSITTLVNSSPESLNALNELADALGNDPNFAQSVSDSLANKSDKTHDHDVDYYKKVDLDLLLADKSPNVHNHDTMYYEKSAIDLLLNNKSDSNHSHPLTPHNHDNDYSLKTHNHNDDYYTKSEINTLTLNYVFGQNFQRKINTDILTVKGFDEKEHLQMSCTITDEGLYRLGWSYSHNSSHLNRSPIYIKISKDNSIIHEITHGNYSLLTRFAKSLSYVGNSGSKDKDFASGFDYEYLTPGSYSFTIKSNGFHKKYYTSVWNSQFEFWRVE